MKANEGAFATPLKFQNDDSGRRDAPVGNYCLKPSGKLASAMSSSENRIENKECRVGFELEDSYVLITI